MAADANTSATETLAHPLVVWAAWLRVDEWYRSGNLAPQPELSEWRLHPEEAVRSLAEELRAGKWQPSAWLQLPYPKRGACLRHYVMPTVKDQVAFMAYLVLLGPLLDSRFLPFVFGNRLYRPIAWNTRLDKPRWEQRGYPFLNRRTYLPYARSHGMFRRVASWTVSRMTKAPLREEDYAGRVHHPDNYDKNSLPAWLRDCWWLDEQDEGGAGAYWASLDIQLAYPSLRLTDLSKALRRLVDMPCMSSESLVDLSEFPPSTTYLDDLLDGYPQSLLVGLGDQEERRELSEGLVTALKGVRVVKKGIPAEAWKPFHARAKLPPENKGLPTGLAVSGLLLNVAMHSVDSAVVEYLAIAEGAHRGAIVRFADDMYLMSRSSEGLFRLIDVVWGAVEGTNGPHPIKPRSKSNLHINLSKVDPPPVKKALHKCLEANCWSPCRTCGELEPGSRAASLYQWWLDGPEKSQLKRDLNRASIRAGDVGPFVTTLVERLSEIGRDTLADRFGQGAKDRQVQLHDLARFDIADEQVRADTRRTFAVNRLAGAWLSTDTREARRELSEIRRSVATVFTEIPWKFALWSAVVRVAGRRVDAESRQSEDDEEARNWLGGVLRRVAIHGEESWMSNWPEETAESPHLGSNVDWRGPYLSFHRTAFWQALANVIRLLYSHHERHDTHGGGHELQSLHTGASPLHWATRVPEGLHGHVAQFLGDVDKWTSLLYGDDPRVVDLPPWELDPLVTACLAAVTKRVAADEWHGSGPRGRHVAVPEGTLERAPATSAILARNGRLAVRRDRRRALPRSLVGQLLLASGSAGIEDALFPEGRKSTVRDVDRNPSYAVAVAGQFHCESRLSDETVLAAVREARSSLLDDPLALSEYGRARAVLLSRGLAWPQ